MPFRPLHSTPLEALEAVSLDTETTGLDAGKSRVIQIGALRVRGGQALPEARFETLVDPGEPIPPATTKVHGLSDADVQGAPDGRAALLAFEEYRAGAAIIGHTISFDLAILKREADIAGIPWRRPRALDVRWLARLARPQLASYSLDRLCDWLEIEIKGRHTALGDAIATAEVFARLAPMLREMGIRTIAEAEAQSRAEAERSARVSGGAFEADPWASALDGAESEADGPRSAVARIDSYPYRHRVRDLMSAPPQRLGPEQTVREAVAAFVEKGVSSVFVAPASDAPARAETDGIVTERDVLRMLHKLGEAALDAPLGDVRTAPLHTVSEEAFVYRAIGRMQRLKLRHLGVRNADGDVIGAVTTRNLLQHRSSAAVVLGDEILAADDEMTLARAWAQAPTMCAQLLEEEVDPRTISAVLSAELRALTARAAELVEAEMSAEGRGGPPCAYAVLTLGSTGRGESLLATDQDNAIVFAEGAPDGPEDAWFAEFGARMCGMLDRVGLRACTEGVMAERPAWRRSLAAWRAQIDAWADGPGEPDQRSVAVFLDAAHAHGDRALSDAVWAYALERGAGSTAIRRALAQPLRGWRSPIGVFGSMRLEGDGRVDLKAHGLSPIFTAARALAVQAHAKERATPDRLQAAAREGAVWAERVEPVIEAHQTLMSALLAQQIADVEAGTPLGSRVDPRVLDKRSRAALRGALSAVETAVGFA